MTRRKGCGHCGADAPLYPAEGRQRLCRSCWRRWLGASAERQCGVCRKEQCECLMQAPALEPSDATLERELQLAMRKYEQAAPGMPLRKGGRR